MKILLAENDAQVAADAAHVLESEGHTVISTSGGVEALQAWLEQQPELLVLSAALPQLSGVDVCRLVRRSSSVPIVMLIPAAKEDVLVHSYEYGADDCILKPFSMRQLVLRVEVVLRRMQNVTGAAINKGETRVEIADLSIDYASLYVRKNHAHVPMTQLEFRLLYCLATNVNHVVQTPVLARYAWGADVPDEGGRLKTHLSRLRHKLIVAGGTEFEIRAIPHMGYMMMPKAAAPSTAHAFIGSAPKTLAVNGTDESFWVNAGPARLAPQRTGMRQR